MPGNISLNQAKRIAVASQLLNKRNIDTFKIINHLGYIQIDTISVIQRAHHHTLWNRNRHYQPAELDKLLSEKRNIYEYWGHAASYLPMKDFRYSLPVMHAYRSSTNNWVQQRRELAKDYYESVYERIKAEGDLGAADFEHKSISRQVTWGSNKPAKAALELLAWEGKLLVSRRDKFHKKYDLTERIIPPGTCLKMPTTAECAQYQIKKAINSYGFASIKTLTDYMFNSRDVISEEVENLLQDNKIIKIKIEGIKNREYYAKENLLNRMLRTNCRKRAVFLSPFDNMIIHRKRILELNNFDYALECYYPQKKRKFGYFVLPILYGCELVGRIDIKADRKSRVMIINNLFFEDTFCRDERFDFEFEKHLTEFMEFNHCSRIIHNYKNNKR